MKKNMLVAGLIILIIAIGVYVIFLFNSSNDKEYVFEGIIESVEGNNAIVIPDEDESDILSSGDKVSVAVPKDEFNVGDNVIVTYDGKIMESYPLQINLIKIEKK